MKPHPKLILHKALIFAFVFLLLSSCKKNEQDPSSPQVTTFSNSVQACFQTNSYIKKVREACTFENCSLGFDTFQWNFGDGGSASGAMPTYTFITKGLYPVTLTVIKGIETSQVTKNVLVVNNGVIVDINTNFRNWRNKDAKYTLIKMSAYLVRANDLMGQGDLIASLPMMADDLDHSINFRATTGAIMDGTTAYRIRVELTGHYKDQNSATQVELMDSFATGEIDLVNGIKTPSGMASTNYADVDYAIMTIND